MLLGSFGCADSPPKVANGVWKGNNISVIIICNSGYKLIGVNTLNCVEQKWEEVTQICEKCMYFVSCATRLLLEIISKLN